MSELKTKNQNLNRKTNVKYRAYYFAVGLVKFAVSLPSTRAYWIISDQLLRSATSIGANIVEAKAASSKRDFIKFYQIALKSANETQYRLCLLRDATGADKEKIKMFLKEVDEVARMLGSSLLTLKNKK